MIKLKRILENYYRGEHVAPGREEGCPLYDLRINNVYPKDVYNTLYQYSFDEEFDDVNMSVVRRCKENPHAPVWIYRSVPKDIYDIYLNKGEYSKLIQNGDWVTLNKKYAQQHDVRGKVVSKRVKAYNVWTDGNSLSEWGYWK
jgi:hypothetical protein